MNILDFSLAKFGAYTYFTDIERKQWRPKVGYSILSRYHYNCHVSFRQHSALVLIVMKRNVEYINERKY